MLIEPGKRGDLYMILVQAPCKVLREQARTWGIDKPQKLDLAHSREAADGVAAWWQAVQDFTHNVDRFGEQSLRHPAAYAAMEEFLLSAFTTLALRAGRENAFRPARRRAVHAVGLGSTSMRTSIAR